METRAARAKRRALAPCCICGEENNLARPVNCNHHFHLTCLLHWCEYENTCPVCRQFFNHIICAEHGVLFVPDCVQHESDSDDSSTN